MKYDPKIHHRRSIRLKGFDYSWLKSPLIRTEVVMDESVIMPNHLHGIVLISNKEGRNKNGQPVSPTGPKNKSISALVAGKRFIIFALNPFCAA